MKKNKQGNWQCNYPEPTNIVFRYYKNPIAKLPKPLIGYQGTILEDVDTGRIQCAICGKWFYSLAGHLKMHREVLEDRGKTNTKQRNFVNAYKDLVGLMHGTALCSEEIRSKIIETRKNEPYWEKDRKKNWVKKRPAKNHKGFNNLQSEEKRNKEQRCVEQLLEFLEKAAIKHGRVPLIKELVDDNGINIYQNIVRMFGSYKEALGIKNLKKRTEKKGELSDVFLIACLKNFRKNHGRMASISDFNNLLPAIEIYNKRFGSYKKALKLIKNQD